MSSLVAGEIIKLFETAINKKLDQKELLMCEDLAYNIYKNPLNMIIRGKLKQSITKFNVIYNTLLNGTITTIKRPNVDQKFRFLNYQKQYLTLCNFLGDDFSMRELDFVVDICKNAQYDELVTSVHIAMERGIRSLDYVKAVIIGKRRVKSIQTKYEKEKFQKIDEPVKINSGVNVSTALWKKRIGDDKLNEITINEAEKKSRIS